MERDPVITIIGRESGRAWQVPAYKATLSETRGTASSLNCTILKAGDLSFLEGDLIRMEQDGNTLFSGYVFTKKKSRFDEIEITAFDRLRYLKANASYAFYARSAADIISEISADMEIPVGTLASTPALPSLVCEDMSCLDIITKAAQDTLLQTGTLYTIYDDYDSGISLQEAAARISDMAIGDRSLVTEYTYTTDIDKHTYNRVKLARPNEDTGRADVVIAEDSANIGRWGLLQLYTIVDESLNEAQMIAQAEATLNYTNSRRRSLSITSLGVPGLRAGQMIAAKIEGLGDIDLDGTLLVDSVTHTWETGLHTMQLEAMIP